MLARLVGGPYRDPVLMIPAAIDAARTALQGGSADASAATPVVLAAPDWSVIGLVLSIIGSFLLANAILFRHPKHMVRERFGREKAQLRTIREYIFHRVQVSIGFTCLLSGFGLQLFGRYRPLPADAPQTFPVLWITLVTVAVVSLMLVGWWWSLIAFRRYVRSYFLQNPPDFEADLEMAREVGELFGISSHGEDTVHSYVERLRTHVMLPHRKQESDLPDLMDPTDEIEAEGRLV